MKFSYTAKRERNNYAQRSVAMGPRGMVASSQQLATLTGYRVLSKGGNAVEGRRFVWTAIKMSCLGRQTGEKTAVPLDIRH